MPNAIDSIFHAYKTTAEAKDLDSHLAIYSDEILLFDVWDQWTLEGKSALRKMVTDWFGSLGDETVRIDFEALQSRGTTEMAYGTAIVKYSAVSSEGEVIRWLQNRMTLVLEMRAGSWKIVHQHTSAPVGDDMKVKLQR